MNYRDRSGRSIQNDANADWLKPAMREAYRVLKPNRVAVMFYGWTNVDAFFEAWKLPFPARRTYRLLQIV